MNERQQVQTQDSLEERSRALFHDSVEDLDFALRSRLTQARHAAIEAAATGRRSWFSRFGMLTPVAGVTAAAILGAFLWLGSPVSQRPATLADGAASTLEDLEIVASAEEGGGDALDMLQDDIDFYDWADKSANSGPAA